MMTMTAAHPTRLTPQSLPQRLLAWTFRRGSAFLTCELYCDRRGEYTVSLMPHSASSTMVIEHLTSGVDAFHRHAAIALQLRHQGWTVVAYAPVTPRTPAPQMYPLAA